MGRRTANDRVAVLDLHGVRHGDVEGTLHRFINDHWAVGWRLRIVTGRSSAMRRLVSGVLAAYRLDPVWDDVADPGWVDVVVR